MIKFLIPITISLLVSIGLAIISPIIAFILLLFGIASLPYGTGTILFASLLIAVLGPGIIINLSLSKGASLLQRIASVVIYLTLFIGIWYFIAGFVLKGFHSLGQF